MQQPRVRNAICYRIERQECEILHELCHHMLMSMGDAIYCLSDQYLLARLYIYIYRYIYVCVYAYAHIFVVNLGVLLM